MELKEIVEKRRAIRSFKDHPIEREVLERLLQIARYAPSWANTQPWELAVVSGEIMEKIRREYQEAFDKGEKPLYGVPFPEVWTRECQERMLANKEAIFQRLGIDKGDEDKILSYKRGMISFFNAPVSIFVHMNQLLGQWSMFDLGLLSQTIMLLLQDAGLDCIPAVTLVAYPSILRKYLGIPKENKIVIGIAIGHAQEGVPINQHRSARLPLGDNCRWFGY